MKAGKYEIKWQYGDEIYSSAKKNGFKKRHNRTFCFIYSNKELVISDYALCSLKDHFCRDTGRKLSLARAMKNANIPKEERKSIWEVYRDMKPNKRW